MTKRDQNITILLLGALAAIGPFSIDMYLPAFPSIAQDLHTDIAHVGFSLTSYFIGISAGQLIYGPLIDRFGRKKPLLIGLALYFIAAAGCAFSPTINALIGLRLLLALGGCVGMVAGRAVVRDLFPASETAKVFSMLLLVMGIAPIIAPSIGGIVSDNFGWRVIFGLLMLISALILFAIMRFLPESKGPDATVSLKPEKIVIEYIKVLKDPKFLTYAIAGGFSSAGMFAYIAGSPFVFMKLFGLSQTHYGWLFSLNAGGYIMASQLNRFFLKTKTSKQVSFVSSTIQCVAGLTLAAGTALGLLNSFGVMGLIFTYLFCQGLINPNTTSLALAPFTKNAGSASAMIGSLSMIAGAFASGFVGILFNGTAFPMTIVMACCTTIAFISLFAHRMIVNRNLAAVTVRS